MKTFLIKAVVIIITILVGTTLVDLIVKPRDITWMHEYQPRITQQESRRMIKDIHEHLGLGE